MSATHNITLDVNSAVSQAVINAVKGDNDRSIVISLSENGLTYSIPELSTAVLRAVKPDGTILYNICTIADNKITHAVTNQETAAVGNVECCLSLYSPNDELLHTPRFTIRVASNLVDDSEIESTNEFSALTYHISRLETIETEATAAEESRSAAEALRVTAEAGRVSAEASRVTAETARATAESARAGAETNRTIAESARADAEDARNTAEGNRATAETARATAETARSAAESARATAEAGRVDAENLRVLAEAARVSAEEAREAAESDRDKKWGAVTAHATTLTPGQEASANVTQDEDGTHFSFNIPAGEKGNVMFATFVLDPSTGNLTMLTDSEYTGPLFQITADGYMEVMI